MFEKFETQPKKYDINAMDKEMLSGYSLLSMEVGYPDVVKSLLKLPAIDVRLGSIGMENKGNTPLHQAVIFANEIHQEIDPKDQQKKKGIYETMARLIKKGADIRQKNALGASAHDIAESQDLKDFLVKQDWEKQKKNKL